MPLCLMCPKGNQPSFLEIRDLTDHISQVHTKPVMQPATPPNIASTQCCICNKRFTSNAGLISHQNAKQHYLPCPTCSKPFLAPEELAQHQLDVHSSPSILNDISSPSPPEARGSVEQKLDYDCRECKRRFESPTELEKHQRSHQQFPCSKCDQFFPSLVDWNTHFKSAHPRFQCGGCKAVLTSESELALHGDSCPAIDRPTSSQSSGNKNASSSSRRSASVLCDLCNKSFKDNDSLQAHVSAKHSAAIKCAVCQLACPSPTALEKHVDTFHSCAVCQDGIVRDTRALGDHMADHTHPVRCGKCGTRYRSEEERSLHFAAPDNNHPTCVRCQCGFVDDLALQMHMASAHPPSPRRSPRAHLKCAHCDENFTVQANLEAHMAAMHSPVFECGVCHHTTSSQVDLDAHISVAHTCPICNEANYLDLRALHDHLDEHRAPYRCLSCGTAYVEEEELLQHYKTSSKDVHPVCIKCDVGFENSEAYHAHVEEVHPRISCDSCDGILFDREDLPAHYLTSRNHPVCDKCGLGFKDQSDFADHGATEHPESHCSLCQWQFDSPDSLHYHIRHFFNHPKCIDCDLRFADADAYHHHLFAIHRPGADARRDSDSTAIPPDVNCQPDTYTRMSSPQLRSQAPANPQCGSDVQTGLSQTSFRPLPSNLSSYSSPRSQRIVTESPFQISPRTRSRSSTLSVRQSFSGESQHWGSVSRTVPLDDEKTRGGTPEFNHSPLSMLPVVGTPPMSSTRTITSVGFRSPFSPRPEMPSLLPSVQGLNGIAAAKTVEVEDSDSDGARSPNLISPVIKLPDSEAVSPSSTTSSWTASIPDPSLSLLIRTTSSPRLDGDQTGSWSVGPATESLVVAHGGPSVASASASLSSLSPESAEISLSAHTTPEYLREARAFLSLTHHALQPSSPQTPHSPISSPILSSTGLALGSRGQRREVRFEDNIMSEPVWESPSSASSDTSLHCSYRHSPPRQRARFIPSNPSFTVKPTTCRDSKLPRLSSQRGAKVLNGKATRRLHDGPSPNGRVNGNTGHSYHCRACWKDPCDDLTTTTCGHLFCYDCIADAVMKDSRCPVCDAPTLLYCLFRIDTSS